MPIGPFRTYNQPVNVGSLDERFDAGADVTLEALRDAGLISKLSLDVKILGEGELTKKLSVTAHSFSRSAIEKIEAAGGTVTRLREPVERKKKKHKASAPAPEAADEDEVAEEAEPEPAEVETASEEETE
jgi:Ribosomal proteins 50S-L15, 50S-L18e, 60S-L27A